jgi:hypothetical protein
MTLRSATRTVCCVFLSFLSLAAAQGQEGHPMSGVWVGDWGFSASERKRVVIVLEWEGTDLSGVINPGPNAVQVKLASADPSDWSLHMEADTVNATGQPATWIIDGQIDDLGTYNRTIAGSWNVGNEQGTFSITRQ